ncbi:MAG TPA: type VI secretion system baseplate subunit TssG [Methylibium sp.]
MSADRQAAVQSLFGALQAAPHAHDFFALLRRIEALHPEAPRFGQALRPSQEALRLGQEPELDFAPAALASFEPHGAHAPRLGVRFFGLLGPQGPLPLHLTEYARERARQRGDPTFARFLDVFHHRLLSLFYRAWAQGQPTVQHDRPQDDRFAAWLGACFGHGAGLSRQGSLGGGSRLFQAGLLASRSRHPEGLAKILALHFDIPARIQQYVPHWMDLEREDRCRLGHARSRSRQGLDAGAPARLGMTATSGRKAWDRQYKFRIVLGPLTLAQYRALLPGGAAWRELRDWVLQYVGLDLEWDVELCLARNEVPQPHLGRQVQLGLTGWLGRRRTQRDASDLRLRPRHSFLLHRQGASHV